MRIIWIHDELTEIFERTRFILESQFQASVTAYASINIYVMHEPPSQDQFAAPDLFILDLSHGNQSIYDKLTDLYPKVLKILVHDQSFPADKVAQVAGQFSRGSLLEGLVTVLDILIMKGAVRKSTQKEDYCKVSAPLLLSLAPLGSDIYIGLSKTHFVKILRSGSQFEEADLEKYQEKKGVNYLFIRRDECNPFIERFTEELNENLSLQKPTIEEVLVNHRTVYETAQQLVDLFGFTKEVQNIAKTQVQIAMKSIGTNPSLSDIMGKVMSSKGAYLASHSMALAYVACGLASKIEWSSETTFFKLSMAAFLHDFALRHEAIGEIQSEMELEATPEFTEDEKKLYRLHPIRAAELARQFQQVPPDVDRIIVEHHERPDGSGFPRGLRGPLISPLSSVFIVAHDMVMDMRDEGEKFRISSFVEKHRKEYDSGNFKAILRTLESES